MKKYTNLILLALVIMITLCACSHNTVDTENSDRSEDPTSMTDIVESSFEEPVETTTETESEVDAYNRAIVAEATGLDEDEYFIDNWLSAFNTLDVGLLQSAEYVMEDDDGYLYFVAEDSTNYRMLLSQTYRLVGVQNIDTGEWVIRSMQ